jgi:hypothetical protein
VSGVVETPFAPWHARQAASKASFNYLPLICLLISQNT